MKDEDLIFYKYFFDIPHCLAGLEYIRSLSICRKLFALNKRLQMQVNFQWEFKTFLWVKVRSDNCKRCEDVRTIVLFHL